MCARLRWVASLRGRSYPPRKAGGRRRPMSEENKAKVRRLFEEGFSQGNTDVVDEVLNPNFVCYDPNSESGEVRGSETIKGEIEYFRNAVPDLTYTIEDQIAEGDRMVTRYTASGTHQGEFFGVAPSGERITMSRIMVDRFEDEDCCGVARIRSSRGDAPARSSSYARVVGW